MRLLCFLWPIPSGFAADPVAHGIADGAAHAVAHVAARSTARARFFRAGALTARVFGWSINLFRIRGIQLALHASWVVWLVVVAGMSAFEEGWASAGRTVVLLVTLYVCVVLHELGHCFTAMAYGIGVQRILLLPIGGMAEMDEIPRAPRRELLITLAGPAVNFVIAGVLFAGLRWVEWPDAGLGAEAGELLGAVALWNLAMGVFDLIPAFPMDGGRILRASLAGVMPHLDATFCAALIGKIVAGAAIVTVWLFAWWTPLPVTNAAIYTSLFGFIIVVGEIEYRAARRLEVAEAHWRMVYARQAERAAREAAAQDEFALSSASPPSLPSSPSPSSPPPPSGAEPPLLAS
ncbi:MAG: hypothetical protein RLZZ15_3428 [Verrucomicrobiota bacterium]